ncbi:MAG: coenzyme A pyrophosphatase [Desulfobacteraceae bacterium 4572_130]|nr:MAG: coenzyme A pyrophosphatase [Desulfobacteraceae bacterium 4572_130]
MICREKIRYHKNLKNALENAVHPKEPENHLLQPTSVIALIYFKKESHLIFIQKADIKGYPWRNQIAFPGGHSDLKDTNRQETAIRELREEMGISDKDLDVVGSLGHFQTINNKGIQAFLGIWNKKQEILYDTREISKIFYIPVNYLIKVHKKKNFKNRIPDIYELTYPYKDIVIWGVTAKITHHFIEIIRNLSI